MSRRSAARWVAAVALAAAACSNSTSTSASSGASLAASTVGPCPAGIGAAMPDLTLPCLAGGPKVHLRAAGTGRPAVVNVWATWCAPCVREVPELVELANSAAGRLDVIGVLNQDRPGNAREFARQYGMHYPSVVDDDGTVLRKFSFGPPVTLFLDGSGHVRYVQRGEIKNAQVLRALVHQHLQLEIPLAAGAAASRRQ